MQGSGLSLFQNHLVHRMRLTWQRARRPDAVMHGQPFRQIWVDPNDIDTALTAGSLKQEDYRAPIKDGRFCKFQAIGYVEDGSWHHKAKPYRPTTELLYDALKLRFHDACRWDETAFHADVLARLARGERPWNRCKSESDVSTRCERADRLIGSIKKEGFLVQSHPVTVSIGPDGQLIKNGNGQHRIMLGLIAGERIPVLPVVRHRAWEDIRIGRSERSAMFRDHPDMLQ